MNQHERHVAIVNRVDAVGTCSYQELARLHGVSEMRPAEEAACHAS